jgi:hypothetical protein
MAALGRGGRCVWIDPAPGIKGTMDMSREMLQHAEYQLFGMALKDAMVRAEGRDLPGGFACLLAGLDRSREYARAGVAWARKLEQSYVQALEDYVRRYQVE